ncbi:hypothetical protein NQ317_004980 [Molorchus minor]|uniref:Uncharacterized protein n=1 Tax=Molorchus minor TaxID=1323400 RepID=A0ABQ9K3Q7_9CUCU|nr:hypothetical protein NQ317_004980 [Molorchus minor]
MSQKNAMDQDPINSFKSVVDDCKYKILVHQVTKEESLINVEETTLLEEQPSQNITTWNQTETLALINIFSLFRDKFKKLKSKKRAVEHDSRRTFEDRHL